jgi:hypothetical protein
MRPGLWHPKERRYLTAAIAAFVIAVGNAAAQTSEPPLMPPTLTYGLEEKSIVTRFHFSGPLSAVPISTEVISGHAAVRAGLPEILRVRVRDLNAGILEEFGAWHPLWVFADDGSGRDPLVSREEGDMSVIIPFQPSAATIDVSEAKTGVGIVAVDLLSDTHTYCRTNRQDPVCANLANRPPQCVADGPYRAECVGSVTSVQLDGSQSSDPDRDPISHTWTGAFGTAEGPAPTVGFAGRGHFPVQLQVFDDFGGAADCFSTVDVVDTTPPSIQSAVPSLPVLWPPDNKMVSITIAAAASDICGSVACRITSVSINEPPNSDAVLTGNASITSALTVALRAQRNGAGNGRTYGITISCTDEAGNSSGTTTPVFVPHDQRP